MTAYFQFEGAHVHLHTTHVQPCVLCCAVSYCVALCGVKLCNVVSCFGVLCWMMSVVLCAVVCKLSCWVVLCMWCSVLCLVVLYDVVLCRSVLFVSCYVMLCLVIQCCVMSTWHRWSLPLTTCPENGCSLCSSVLQEPNMLACQPLSDGKISHRWSWQSQNHTASPIAEKHGSDRCAGKWLQKGPRHKCNTLK